MKSPGFEFLPRRASVALAMLLLASCGGGGGSPGVTGPAATTPGPWDPGDPRAAVAGSTAIGVTLSGAQETPPNGSTATGSGNMTVDTSNGNFTASVTTSGIVGTAAHIHAAAAGIAGPIVFPMVQTAPGGNTWTTSGQLTSAQVATLNASGYYINVHSAAFPNGEIRGQIVPTQAIVLQPAANSGGGGGGGGGY
jgi:hypothetical protein